MAKNSNLGLKVPFGLKGAILYSPSEISEVGLACGCFCPGCDAQLIVREGTKRRHFSHHGATASNHCVESAIHRAAIQVLLEANWIRVPEMAIEASVPTKMGPPHRGTHVLSTARTIRFDNSDREVHIRILEDVAIRPDVVGYRNGKQLLVEMFFRHAVDEEKRLKLHKLGLPALEINLSDLDLDTGFDAIRRRVLEETAHKEWLKYPGVDDAMSALLAQLAEEASALDEEAERERAARQEHIKREAAARKTQLERDEAARKKRLEDQERRKKDELERRKRAHQAYRDSSQLAKEEQFRIALTLPKVWPRHLKVAYTNNAAIDAPLHIWQTSLFQKFIYHKPLRGNSFEMGEAISWINERFGGTTNVDSSISEAVRQFLAYMGGCGFIDRTYNPYGDDFFKVLHNELMPPPPWKKN